MNDYQNPDALTHDELVDAVKDLREREATLRELVDSAPCMLWTTDAKGLTNYFNKQWVDFCGIRTDDALSTWKVPIHPDDAQSITEKFKLAVTQGQTFEAKYRLRRHDGQYRTMLAHGVPRYDRAGNLNGFVGCTFDISEHKDNKDKLNQTYAEIERRSKEIALLNDLNDNLQVCKTIDETQPILKRFGSKMFPEGAASICLFNASRNIVEPFVSWGEFAAIDHVFAPDDCWALRKGKIHTEQRGDEGLICPNRKSCDCNSYSCFPMMAYGEVIGVLHIDFSRWFVDDPEHVKQQSEIQSLASMTADQVALGLANLRLRETLQYQSSRDPLTQLYNRRYLTESIEREISRAERAKTSIGILMIDIDHFKRFNDTYGHEAGDAVLREFAMMVRAEFRASDIPCRYGGEEFAIILPDAPREVVLARADELRIRAAGIDIDYLGQRVGRITISIGVAHYPHNGRTFEELAAVADRALYRAKSEGRNRVVEALGHEKFVTYPGDTNVQSVQTSPVTAAGNSA